LTIHHVSSAGIVDIAHDGGIAGSRSGDAMMELAPTIVPDGLIRGGP
jgi:hypothetical protein